MIKKLFSILFYCFIFFSYIDNSNGMDPEPVALPANPQTKIESVTFNADITSIIQVSIRIQDDNTPPIEFPAGSIASVNFDTEYIPGVLRGEMGPFWPAEAYRAQAVAARCWAEGNRNKHNSQGADVCNATDCQRFFANRDDWAPYISYATGTVNYAVTYKGTICTTHYFNHCDGHTLNMEDSPVTGYHGNYSDYCRSTPCICGYTTRDGHGVGMCQQGARAMANAGKLYPEILLHYYRIKMPIVKALTIYQRGGITNAYMGSWTDIEASGVVQSRTLNTFQYYLLTGRAGDATVEFEFSEWMGGTPSAFIYHNNGITTYNVENIAVISGTDYKKWRGVIKKDKLASGGYDGLKNLYIEGVDKAGNALDGWPSTFAWWDQANNRWRNYETYNGLDTGIGGKDASYGFIIDHTAACPPPAPPDYSLLLPQGDIYNYIPIFVIAQITCSLKINTNSIYMTIDGTRVYPDIIPGNGYNIYIMYSLYNARLMSHTVYVYAEDVYGGNNEITWSFNVIQGPPIVVGGGGGGGRSCPYVHVYNGKEFEKDNDIMPAGNKSKYKDYYLLMKPLVPKDSKYLINIVDSEDEVSSMDEIKLLQIDHPKGTKIAPTPEGKILAYSNPAVPVSVKDKNGRDLSKEISGIGNGDYHGYKGDYLILEFEASSINNAKIILSSDLKCPETTTAAAKSGITTRGKAKSSINSNHKKSLHVYIFNKEERWEKIGVVHPHQLWDIYAIEIPKSKLQITNRKIKVKIEWTEEHKLDYCWLDTSEKAPITVTELPLIKAKHSKDGDVLKELTKSDNKYAVTKLNDVIELEFPCFSEPKEERSFIFISNGFYKPNGTISSIQSADIRNKSRQLSKKYRNSQGY